MKSSYLKSLILVSVSMITAICLTACGGSTATSEASSEAGDESIAVSSVADASSAETEEGIGFPYELEDGKLIVNSLFQSTIMNPDNGDEYGEDIASIEVVNNSDQYMELTDITVTLDDSSQIYFEGTSIPAGKTVWLFAKGNETIGAEPICAEITDSVTYGETSVMEDRVKFTVDDTVITLENITGEDLYNVTVGCHCLFEEQYFGGLTYNYPVEMLPAGGTVTIDAAECYLGVSEIVYIRE